MTSTKTNSKSVDKYIEKFPPDVKEKISILRKLIKNQIPNCEESISYNMPVFKFNGKYLVYFAVWKNHISLYPFEKDMEKFLQKNNKYKISGKGTIQFPLDQPLPEKLIKNIINFLLEKN